MITRFLVAGALAVCSLFVGVNDVSARESKSAKVQAPRCVFIGDANIPVPAWYARDMYEFYQNETPLWYQNFNLVTLFLLDVGVVDATDTYTFFCLMPLIAEYGDANDEYGVITTLFDATGVQLLDLEDLDVLILLN